MNYFKIIWDLGRAMLSAIQEGRTQETVFDVLPERYRDRELLKKLEDKARDDYSK